MTNIDTFIFHGVLELNFESSTKTIKTIDIHARDPPIYRKTKLKVSYGY